MSTYFTIGEISKLFNLPIKTLRYYDEKGILKPAYINKENNYRYYSREQFMNIDVIKYCKLIGMSLEEIKVLMNSDGSIESMLDTMKRQSKLLDQKIQELSNIKKYLDDIQRDIEGTLVHDLEKVFIKYNEDRIITRYDCNTSNIEEFDMALRKVIIHLEYKYNDVYPFLGASVSYDKIVNENKLLYKEIRDFSTREIGKNSCTLPAGEYVTVVFDDNWNNVDRYYKKILEYIKLNNIEVIGDFNEIWVMPRVDNNGKEKTLVQLEILKKG